MAADAIYEKNRLTSREEVICLNPGAAFGAAKFWPIDSFSKLAADLVDRRGWLCSSDVTEALAYTKPMPGSTVVQVVTFLGWRMGGWAGAIIGTIAFLLPAFALMTVAAAAVLALPDAAWVRGALTGLQTAVIGVLAAALWHLARSEAGSGLLVIVLISAFAAGLFVNAALVVAAAGAIGVAVDRGKPDA